MDVERMQAASAAADQELSRQSKALNALRVELERTGEALDSRAYSDLRARIELQEMRVETAIRKARESQAVLGTARNEAEARLRREQARRAVDTTLARLNETRAALESKQQAIRDLQNQVPTLANQHNALLAELDRAKTNLQNAEVLTNV
jgi:chromosome segregation ATPase